ncbi:hypothetical protein HanRHA438_Chr05g0214321 [Helianthus annuus]|nr:hypothetical protein HanHA300_Chr05g0167891 [Helianthus annuus]KAJ0583893.1 hypothetical protein HanHA89_Chr05g0181941 [Helianthus annuus]KAJ0918149.1 hypothetical protein HanRHA438_Chr05g0214321 [Helianthus annuus]
MERRLRLTVSWRGNLRRLGGGFHRFEAAALFAAMAEAVMI